MNKLDGYRFLKSHEWIKVDESGIGAIGISHHAQEELGDIALVQLPEIGRMLQFDERLGEIESIKAVSDLYSPASGEVVDVNAALENAPELVNNEPYDGGWLLKIRLTNPRDLDGLLAASDYEAFVQEH